MGDKERERRRRRRRLLGPAALYSLTALILAAVGFWIADRLGWGSTAKGATVFVIVMAVQVVFVARADPEERGIDLSSRWAVVGALALAIALPTAVAGLLVAIFDTPSARAACPEGPGRFFTRGAVVSGHGPEIHTAASVTSQVTRIISSDCKLPFVGYCIGDVVLDATHPEVPDSRWFILPKGQGLIPSGQTVGNPPAGMRPQRCKGGVSPPNSVTIREAVLDPSGRYIRLGGYSLRAAFVGFALRLRDGRWRRIGWDRGPEDPNSFEATIEPPALDRVEIAAVACVAVDNPTSIVDLRRSEVGRIPPVRQPFRVRQPTGATPAPVACKPGTKLPR
jgi:hypothetical protein